MKNGLIVANGGDKFWYKDDQLHREDGPAVEFVLSRSRWWYKNGRIHREDGPAVEGSGSLPNIWYYHGEYIKCNSQQEFERIIKLKAFW